MSAVDQGSPQLVQLLLDHKPNLALRNNKGQTALEFVKANRDSTSGIDMGNNGNERNLVAIKNARRRHDEIIRLMESAKTGNR
jgi:ankyrin repeat protein